MELVIASDNQKQFFDLPSAPDHWLQLHKVATGASLAAGALAYSMTHLSGKAATSILVNTITMGGSLVAHAGRVLGGELVGIGIQSGTRVTAFAVEQAGDSATFVGSLLASTAAAVTVGSAFLVGNTIYDLYTRSRIAKPIPEPVYVTELEDAEYIVYQLEDGSADTPTDGVTDGANGTTDMEAVD